jgi:hypothetical protein
MNNKVEPEEKKEVKQD